MSSPPSAPTTSATDTPAKPSSSIQQEQLQQTPAAGSSTSTPITDSGNAPPPASLYVGDLDPSVTEADLYEFFNAVGPVASIRVCRDAVTRRSLGYAYVNYHNAADGETALNVLNYTAIKGQVCRLMWSQRDPSLRKTGNGNIFIKNLDVSIDNKALHDTFSAFGNILSCKIATDMDGKSKGYGFVHYETDEAAQNAIKHVDGMLLNDKKVFVGYHVAKKDRQAQMDVFRAKFTNVYVKNLDTSITDKELNDMFSKYGPVSSALVSRDEQDGTSKGFGFVNFENSDDAQAAVDDLNEKEINGKILYVGRAQKKFEREEELRRQYEQAKMEKLAKYQGVNLYIKNLDDDFDDERLHQEFSVYGVITSAKIMRDERGDSKGFGFVCFSSPDEATKAVTEMNGRMVGSKPIYVALAQRKEVRRSQLDAQMNQRNQMQMQQNVSMAGGPYMGGAPMFYAAPMGGYRPVYPPSGMMPRPRWAPQHGQPMPGGYGGGGPQGNYPMQPRPPMHGGGIHSGTPPPHIPQSGRPQSGAQQQTEPKNTNAAANDDNKNALSAATPEMQKQMLGERLYPLIHGRQPEYAGKITGMLLEMENSELLNLLDDQVALDRKIKEAMDVLNAHLADESKDNA